MESEDNEGEDDGESDGGVGTPPDSPSNTLDSAKPLSPGEFDPTIDVYAIKSNDGESRPPQLGLRRFNPSSIGSLARPLSGNNLLCVWLVMQNREKQNCVRVFSCTSALAESQFLKLMFMSFHFHYEREREKKNVYHSGSSL